MRAYATAARTSTLLEVRERIENTPPRQSMAMERSDMLRKALNVIVDLVEFVACRQIEFHRNDAGRTENVRFQDEVSGDQGTKL